MAGKFGVTSYTIAGLVVPVLSDTLQTIPPLASPSPLMTDYVNWIVFHGKKRVKVFENKEEDSCIPA
jgi:hypothetical protein